jgi:hypothetical protein
MKSTCVQRVKMLHQKQREEKMRLKKLHYIMTEKLISPVNVADADAGADGSVPVAGMEDAVEAEDKVLTRPGAVVNAAAVAAATVAVAVAPLLLLWPFPAPPTGLLRPTWMGSNPCVLLAATARFCELLLQNAKVIRECKNMRR